MLKEGLSPPPIHSHKTRQVPQTTTGLGGSLLIVKSVSQLATPRPLSTPLRSYCLAPETNSAVARPSLFRKAIVPAATINLYDYVDGPRRHSITSRLNRVADTGKRQQLSRGFSWRNIRLASLLETHNIARDRSEGILSVISPSLGSTVRLKGERPRTGKGVKGGQAKALKAAREIKPMLAILAQGKKFRPLTQGNRLK